MSDRTEWFPVSVKPVRAGLYECWYAGCRNPVMRRWNGHRWVFPEFGDLSSFGRHQDQWRGLTRAAYIKAGGK